MKKYLTLIAVAAMLVSCGENKSTQPKDNGLQKAEEKTQGAASRIAYIEVDSLVTQLEMCKEAKAALEAKGKSCEQQIAAKQKAFQQAYEAFGQKMQSTGYSSQAEYEAAQKNLQKIQEDGARLEQQLGAQLAKEQEEFNTRLHDAVQAYLKTFNADKRYDMIISKSGDNILYANPSLDITEEVIKGINKRYSKKDKAVAPKAEK